MPDVTELARTYIGGLAHVHTQLSNHKGHFESDQTVTSMVATLAKAGLVGGPEAPIEYIMINEHASNPARPHPLGRLSLRERALRRERWTTQVRDVPVLHGFEASLMPDGHTDLTTRLAANGSMIIASRHWLPEPWQSQPDAIEKLFHLACQNPVIDALGHPARDIEAVTGVDWPGIFRIAAETNTAVEVNLNNFPVAAREPARYQFWTKWLAGLSASGASVFLGSDLHNELQIQQFIANWGKLSYSDDSNALADCLWALDKAKISPNRVVNARYEPFKIWLGLDKSTRNPHN